MAEGFTKNKTLEHRAYRNFIFGLILLGVMAIPCTLATNRVLKRMHNAPITWLPKNEPAYQEWLRYLDRYHFVDVLYLSWDGCEIGSPEIEAAYEALKPLTEKKDETATPVLAQLFTGEQVYRSLRDAPMNLSHSAAFERLRKTLIGQDGKTTCIVLGLSPSGSQDFDLHFARIQELLRNHPLLASKSLRFVGPRMEMDAIDRASQQAIDQFWLPSLGLGILVCFCFLRSIPLTLAVLAVALSSQGWALAIIEWLGGEINAVLIVLLPLSFVLAVSSGIHLSNYYLDCWRSDPNLGLSEILAAMKIGKIPCILAALTTMIGLISLWWVPLWPLQWFGTIGAFITAATLIVLWLILPGAMLLDLAWKRKRLKWTHDSVGNPEGSLDTKQSRIASLLTKRLEARANGMLLGFGVLVLSLIAGIFDLRTTVDVERMLPTGHSVKMNYAWYEENVGPLVNAEMELEFPSGAIDSFHDRVELVRSVHEAIKESDSNCSVLSAVTFIPNLPQGGNVGAVVRRRIIQNRIENQFPSLVQAGFALQDNGSEFWRFNLRYPFHSEIDSATRLKRTQRSVEAILDAHPNVVLRISGTTALAEVAQDLLFDGLFKSFLSTFALIWVAMFVMLRSVASSIIAMIPNLFPFLVMFGALGLVREPLDIGIVMAASVALGIAVDDTIHFLTYYRTSLKKGASRSTAVHQAIQHCGMAMMQTTSICIATMFLYVFSDFVPTQKFSLLMSALLLAALIGDIVLLPALLWSPLGAVTELRRGTSKDASS